MSAVDTPSVPEDRQHEQVDTVVVRFCGDSGDGMQLQHLPGDGLPASHCPQRRVPPAAGQGRPDNLYIQHGCRQALLLPPLRGEIFLRAAVPSGRDQCQRELPVARYGQFGYDRHLRRPQLGAEYLPTVADKRLI